MTTKVDIPTNSPKILGSHFDQATESLLAPASLDIAKLQNVLGDMMSHKIDYADLYFQFTKNEGWSLEEGIVKTGHFSIDQGVGVRVVSAGSPLSDEMRTQFSRSSIILRRLESL